MHCYIYDMDFDGCKDFIIIIVALLLDKILDFLHVARRTGDITGQTAILG